MVACTILFSVSLLYASHWFLKHGPSAQEALSKDDAMAYALSIESRIYSVLCILAALTISTVHFIAFKIHSLTAEILEHLHQAKKQNENGA